MRIYFTTVNRKAPLERGGELVALDWDSKRVLRSIPIVPGDPAIVDPNPRGNTRGGRGLALLSATNEVMAADYHSLRFFDRDLAPTRRLSNPLMASNHEIAQIGESTFLVASTAIDAALEIDIRYGRLTHAYFPREHAAIQSELGVTPLEIDKQADNRTRFLGSDHFKHPHHLHLNAVATYRGAPIALFSKHGAIADLESGAILARDTALRGAHNLLIDGDRAYVNHTVGKGVLVFDLAKGRRERHIGWGSDERVARLLGFAETKYAVLKRLERIGLLPVRASLPGFARGLARSGDRIFVGISPASILEIDEASGEVVDLFTWSRNVDACIHGIVVEAKESSP